MRGFQFACYIILLCTLLVSGSYSFFPVKTFTSTLQRGAITSDVKSDLEELGLEQRLLLSKTFSKGLNVSRIIQRVISSTIERTEKQRRLTCKPGACIVSLPRVPIGWSNYEFIVTSKVDFGMNSDTNVRKKRSQDVLLGTIEYSSVVKRYDKSVFAVLSKQIAGKTKLIRIKFNVLQKGDEVYLLSSVASSSAVSQKKLELIREGLEKFLSNLLKREFQLHAARKQQLEVHSKKLQAAHGAENSLKLDKIINPDKYRARKHASTNTASSTGRIASSGKGKSSGGSSTRGVSASRQRKSS
jgi:hypothetical protein